MSKKTTVAITSLVLIFLFGILTSLLFTIFHFILRDTPQFDDSDLALPERTIDPLQNPYPEIRKLNLSAEKIANTKKLELMLQEEEPREPAFTDSVLEDFTEELALFDQWAIMTDWQVDTEIRYNSTHDELNPVRTIAKLKPVEIERHLDSGEIEVAVQKTLLMMKFGQGMENCDGNLIHYLVGSSILGIGQSTLVKILNRRILEPPDLEKLARQLDNFEMGTQGLKHALRLEYHTSSLFLEEIASGKIDLNSMVGSGQLSGPKIPARPNLFFKLNRIKQLQAELFRTLLGEVDLIRKEAPNAASKRLEEMSENRIEMFLSGNAVGEILVSIRISAYEGIMHIPARSRAKHNLLRLRIAMERYRIFHGEWPTEIKDLVPQFISGIPIDRMDREPLRYNRETLKIYSVGQDFIDARGETKKTGPLRDRKEIVIELDPEQ